MLSMSSALARDEAKGIKRQITSKARRFMMISFLVAAKTRPAGSKNKTSAAIIALNANADWK